MQHESFSPPCFPSFFPTSFLSSDPSSCVPFFFSFSLPPSLPSFLPSFFPFFVLFFCHFPAPSQIYSLYLCSASPFISLAFCGSPWPCLSVPLSKISHLKFREAGRRCTVATAAWPIRRAAPLLPYTRTCVGQPFGHRNNRQANALWSAPSDPGLCREVPVYRFRGSSLARTVFPNLRFSETRIWWESRNPRDADSADPWPRE